MKFAVVCLAGWFVLCCATASPFLLMQRYVEDFDKGLNELHDLSHSYVHKQQDFDHHLYNATESEVEEFDFIIVGAGSSGAALANRLSEVPEWKILLLEAGAPETEFTKVPKMQPYLQTTPYSWGYHTMPQETSCLGMIEHRCSLENGRGLGGSSAINDMTYIRGNPKDYDLWADKDNIGWCWDDVLPYFKRIEDCHIEHFDRKHHRYGGNVHLEDPQYFTPHLKDHILEAGHELGIKTVDYNGKQQLGLGIPQVITKNGKRFSTAEAYLEPAVKRENLVIRPLCQVVKILISTHTKEATGVKYLHDSKLFVAKARKEVVLAAGAINSAQLLMLSGIGPQEDLEKLHIECVSDLKVGHNLKDHLGFNGINFIYNETIEDDHHHHHQGPDHEHDLIQYLKDGKGPLTAIRDEVIGFIKTEASKDSDEHFPDLKLLFTPNIFNKGAEHLRYLRYSPEIYNHMWKQLEGHKGFSIIIQLTNPKSRGILKLHDADPLHQPLIDLNQLTDEDDNDLETILAGVKIAVKFGLTESLQKLGIHINQHAAPGCDKHKFDTKEFWICQIKHLSYNLRQVSGTAKMGPHSDKYAVVDNHLKVYGVHKLRVADASVIPVTITGNYLAAEILIGEKAADIIKQEWK